MSILTSSPYSLTFGTLIKARASAQNVVGFGAVSIANTAGVLAKTVPSKMNNP